MAITKEFKSTDMPWNITANGTYKLKGVGPKSTGKEFSTLFALGTWGSGTLTLKVSPDGTEANAIAINDEAANSSGAPVNTAKTLTADGYHTIKVRGTLFLVLSGATGADLNVWVQ